MFAFIVPTAQAGATVAANRVYLIYKYDTRRVAFGLLKEVPYPSCSDAHEHLNELGTADVEERHSGFSGHCSGHQSLACAWRPNQQYPFGYAGAQS